jgi:hypothetical protein
MAICTIQRLLLATFISGVAFLAFGGVSQTLLHAIVRDQIKSSVGAVRVSSTY